jgi:hypothetical protein
MIRPDLLKSSGIAIQDCAAIFLDCLQNLLFGCWAGEFLLTEDVLHREQECATHDCSG